MSAFLGKIHYWLYNKIQVQENLIGDVMKLAKNKGFDSESLFNESYIRYGYPITGDLESEIEHENIHGWLQSRIISVESRLAYVITELLRNDILKIEEVSTVFYQNAVDIMNEQTVKPNTPQDLFNQIYDYMLEGMPCDRINEVIENDETIIRWTTTRDIHRAYWDEANGDINNFNYLRESWINGFLNASGLKINYNKEENGVNTISMEV